MVEHIKTHVFFFVKELRCHMEDSVKKQIVNVLKILIGSVEKMEFLTKMLVGDNVRKWS